MGTVLGMFVELEPHLAMYAWGHRELVSSWLKERTERPIAEAWFGTHPTGPTRCSTGKTLAEEIADDPVWWLGDGEQGQLGWLVKLLAAKEPLSLQVHPDAETARQRWESGHASYSDPYEKPEVLIALTPTWALIGFETTELAMRRARDLGAEQLQRVLAQGCGKAAVQLWQDRELAARCAAEIVHGIAQHTDRYPALSAVVERWAADPSVAVTACLREVFLAAGQYVVLGPGLLHAYISGGGLEVMGASDNVVRGGLTVKPVDVAELLQIVDLAPSTVEPRDVATGVEADILPCRIQHIFDDSVAVRGPAIVWCEHGSMELTAGNETGSYQAGSAVFLPAGAGVVQVRGGCVWAVSDR